MGATDVEAEQRFTFPPRRSGFAAACGALPVAIAAAVLLPYLDAWMLAFFGLAAALPLAALLFPPQWWLPRTITLTEDGIATGRRLIKWEELTEVRKGPLRCTPFVLLRAARPRRLVVPAHAVVLRELLPGILRRRPNVLVSKRAKRALADPERATRIPRWTGLSLFAAAAAATAGAVLVRQGPFWSPLLAGLAAVLFLEVALLASPVVSTGAHALTEATLFPGAFIAMWVPIISGVLDVPFHAMDASVAAAGALFLAAGVVALGRLSLRPLQKGVIVACVVGLPLLVYQLGARSALARTDVTEVFGGEITFPPLFWSEDSALAASLLADGSRSGRHVVADLAGRRLVRLPAHAGSQWMVRLDRACACRTVREQDQWGLYLFRFGNGREIRVSTMEDPPFPTLRHMSPDGRLLCWLAPSENDQPCALKTYDLKADRADELGIEWPGGADITWDECGWADGDTLVVRGHSIGSGTESGRDSPSTLHILRVSYEDRTVQRQDSSRRFAKWRISPDGRHAFAAGPEGNAQPGVHFLDLGTEQTVYIGGEELPGWAADARVALRISRFYGRERWLCRFDVERAAETPVLKIPEGEELVAASPRGRFAILRDRDYYRLKRLSLVNVATGQRRRLPASWGVALMLEWPDACFCPWQSTFSLDGGKFVLQSSTPRQPFGLHLYSVPPEWLD